MFTNNEKKYILSIASKLYDPLGLISPYIVKIKMFMTQLWESGYEWDEELSPDIIERWNQWIKEIDKAKEIHINRCYHKSDYDVKSRILHVFGDASEEAYAATAYLVTEDQNNDISSMLVMSKTRAAS